MTDAEFLHQMLVAFGIVLVAVAIALPLAGAGMRIMNRYQSGLSACLVFGGLLACAMAVSSGIVYVVMRAGWLS